MSCHDRVLIWKAGLDQPKRFSPASRNSNIVRFGPFALLALDVHVLVVALIALEPPWLWPAAASFSALILFTLAVLRSTRRR